MTSFKLAIVSRLGLIIYFIQFNNTIFKYIILPFMRNIKELYTYLTYLLVYFEHMTFYFKIIGC